MKTAFILMAQYDGLAVIPLGRVCADYFPHISPTKMKIKIDRGEIRLPLIAMERSQKSSRGVRVTDLVEYGQRPRKGCNGGRCEAFYIRAAKRGP